MGGKHSKHPKEKKIKKEKEKKGFFSKNHKNLDKIVCPICNASISVNSINNHTKSCIFDVLGKNKIKPCDLYSSPYDYNLNEMIFKNILEYQKNEPNFYSEKRIEDKINELKIELTERKLQNEGQERINLNREDLLNDTLKQTENIDFYKDWTVKYNKEEGIDAGGLLRDFFTNIFQILEGEQLQLFIPSENNEFSYILNPFLFQNEENFKYCRLIGLLLGKAIIQNITINICFNKLIYKMILCEKIQFEDLIFIDNQLYKSLNNLKESLKYADINDDNNNNILKELEMNYAIEMKDIHNHIHSFELIKNGRNMTVNNLDDFIEKRIQFLTGIYEPFIKEIRATFYKYMPVDKIKCLNSDELELLLNGRPFIDVDEWKSFTEYKEPYNENHMVIKWFWEILSELSQKELSNFLLFATGSSRVPLGGFIELEGNDGVINRFTIYYLPYNNKVKNFIKSHTCFNRIELPCFTNKKDLGDAIHFVSGNQIWGFGME